MSYTSQPRYLDPGATWPPPPTDDDRFETVRVNERNHSRAVTGRVVRLWDADVVVDESGDVFCDWCRQFVALQVLASPSNTHGVGLPPLRGPHPMADP